jgi:hypothetical protein
MAQGRRDDADQPAQERDRFEHQMGGAVGPRPLELVGDAAVGGPGQPVVGKRRPRAVAAQPLKRLAVVVGDHHAGVQGEAGTPRAQAIGAAHRVGGGGSRRTPGRGASAWTCANRSGGRSASSVLFTPASLGRRPLLRHHLLAVHGVRMPDAGYDPGQSPNTRIPRVGEGGGAR